MNDFSKQMEPPNNLETVKLHEKFGTRPNCVVETPSQETNKKNYNSQIIPEPHLI